MFDAHVCRVAVERVVISICDVVPPNVYPIAALKL